MIHSDMQIRPTDTTSTEQPVQEYKTPGLLQVGDLSDLRAKGGRYGDHDTGYYYSRGRQ